MKGECPVTGGTGFKCPCQASSFLKGSSALSVAKTAQLRGCQTEHLKVLGSFLDLAKCYITAVKTQRCISFQIAISSINFKKEKQLNKCRDK